MLERPGVRRRWRRDRLLLTAVVRWSAGAEDQVSPDDRGHLGDQKKDDYTTVEHPVDRCSASVVGDATCGCSGWRDPHQSRVTYISTYSRHQCSHIFTVKQTIPISYSDGPLFRQSASVTLTLNLNHTNSYYILSGPSELRPVPKQTKCIPVN